MNGDIKITYEVVIFLPDGEIKNYTSTENLVIECDHEDCGRVSITDKKRGIQRTFTGMPFTLVKSNK